MANYDEEVMNLRKDVETCFDQCGLVKEMVNGGIGLEEGLGDVLGFLEACRSRMPDLIKAGSEGTEGISEALFGRILELNDAINSTLIAEREGSEFPNLQGEQSSKSKTSMQNNTFDGKINKARKQKQVAPLPVPIPTASTLADDMRDLSNLSLNPPTVNRSNSLQPPSGDATPNLSTPAPTLAPVMTTPSQPAFAANASPFNIDLGMSPFHNNPATDTTASSVVMPPIAPVVKADDEDFDSFLSSLQSDSGSNSNGTSS